MQPFAYAPLPAKVVFGFGTLPLIAEEVRALGCSRALVLSTPEQKATAEQVRDLLGDLAAGVFCEAAMHTPVDVTERGLAAARACRADCTVAVGGGSTTGLGKAIALRTDLPQIAVPTTYAGSEATPALGQTANGIKTTLHSPKVLPEVILYDVDLTLTLPPAMAAASGLNAIAHAAEGLYAQNGNPIISLIAEDGVRALASALPVIMHAPQDREARSDALYGAWACGVTLGAVGMALHHKLCHVLGGSFDLPHAQTHAVVLPHALAYNAPAAPEAMARLARALGAEHAPTGVYALERKLRLPASLAELGMPESGLARALDLALANPYWNPRPLERAALQRLLEDAFHGRPPAVN